MPSTRSGRSAAFLSSGETTIPSRSTERKSFVVARKTAGPAGPYAVHVIDEPVELVDPHRACVLEAPLFSSRPLHRREKRLGVDPPAVDAVCRARDREVRDSGPRLDARKQHRLTGDVDGSRVEDDVHGSGPVVRGQERVAGMPAEELDARAHQAAVFAGSASARHAAGRRRRARAAHGGRRASTRRLRSSFTSVSPRPSQQPPVAKS